MLSSALSYTINHPNFQDNDHEFTAFCVEEGGLLGDEAMSLLRKLDSQLPEAAGSACRPGLGYWLRHLALENSRAVGKVLLNHINRRDPNNCSSRYRSSHTPAVHNSLFSPHPRQPSSTQAPPPGCSADSILPAGAPRSNSTATDRHALQAHARPPGGAHEVRSGVSSG